MFDMNTRAGCERINGATYQYEVQTMNGGQALLQSRRFWLAMLDVAISLVTFFAAKYAGAYMDDIRFVIVTIQPILIFLIGAYTYDGAQATKLEIAQINAEK